MDRKYSFLFLSDDFVLIVIHLIVFFPQGIINFTTAHNRIEEGEGQQENAYEYFIRRPKMHTF